MEAIHPQNYCGAYTDIIRTTMEYHGHILESVQSQNYPESLMGEVLSQSCSIIKEVSVLYFPFIALLLLQSCPSLVVLKDKYFVVIPQFVIKLDSPLNIIPLLYSSSLLWLQTIIESSTVKVKE